MSTPPTMPDLHFSLLWGEAHSAVAGFVRGMVGDRATAENLVQDVALWAFRSFASYDRSRPFTAWVLGVARHRVHHHWKKLAQKRPVFQDLTLIDDLAAITVELEEDDRGGEHEALRECLRAVVGRSWEVVRLHYVDGLTTERVAQRLSLAGGHVRVMLHRIRAALRACIERRLAADGDHE